MDHNEGEQGACTWVCESVEECQVLTVWMYILVDASDLVYSNLLNFMSLPCSRLYANVHFGKQTIYE